jgi:hypothetical protein
MSVHGAEFNLDELLSQLQMKPIRSWKKGESRLKHRPEVLHEYSGATFDVSEADMGEHEQLIADAVTFLKENLADIQKMSSFPGVDEVNIDFGVNFKDSFLPTDYLPPEFVSLAGQAGVSICLSHYPFEGGRWEFREDEENIAIELHDATLASIREVDGKTVVRLDKAPIHESPGRPGIDDGIDYWQDVEIELDDATIEASPTKLGVWIADGHVTVKHDNLIDLPCEIRGAIELYFITAENETLRIKASGLRTVEAGEPDFMLDDEE